jgi:predicted alpha/beta-hydrolase family hydrolase
MGDDVTVEVEGHGTTSAVVFSAEGARAGATLFLAHGAGGNQHARFVVRTARAFAARGLDVVTFNFLYSEARRKVPDRPDRLEACYRAVVEQAVAWPRFDGNAVFIGGKSMGGRMASQIAARSGWSMRDRLCGLVFLGYPLHPPGRPDQLRSGHLPDVAAPMLFLQGTRDAFGTPDEIRTVLSGLGIEATVYAVEGGDHSLALPRSAASRQAEVDARTLEFATEWIRSRIR